MGKITRYQFRCDECAFYDDEDASITDNNIGLCRLRPPTVLFDTKIGRFESRFPIVKDTDYCSHWWDPNALSYVEKGHLDK